MSLTALAMLGDGWVKPSVSQKPILRRWLLEYTWGQEGLGGALRRDYTSLRLKTCRLGPWNTAVFNPGESTEAPQELPGDSLHTLQAPGPLEKLLEEQMDEDMMIGWMEWIGR